METVVLRAFDREVVADGARWIFRKRVSGGLVVAAVIAVVAAGCYGAGRMLAPAGGEMRGLAFFVMGAAGLMAVVAAIALAATLFLALVPDRRVFAQADAVARTFRVRGRTLPFGEIRRFALLPSSHGMRAFCVETVAGEVLAVWVATGAQVDALEALAARFNALLAEGARAAPAPNAAPAATRAPFDQRLRTQIIIAMGLLWTVGGFFFFRGLSFASRLQPEGLHIPVWSAGLAILAFGIYDWLRSRRP